MNARTRFSAKLPSRSSTGVAAFAGRGRGRLAAGRTLAENSAQFSTHGQRGTRFAHKPVRTGGTAGLKGKGAPAGAGNTVAGMSAPEFRGPVWCLGHDEAAREAVTDRDFQPGGYREATHCNAAY